MYEGNVELCEYINQQWDEVRNAKERVGVNGNISEIYDI